VLHTNKHRIIPYVKSDYDDSERVWTEHQAKLKPCANAALNHEAGTAAVNTGLRRQQIEDRQAG
jgi:hypothetical protein